MMKLKEFVDIVGEMNLLSDEFNVPHTITLDYIRNNVAILDGLKIDSKAIAMLIQKASNGDRMEESRLWEGFIEGVFFTTFCNRHLDGSETTQRKLPFKEIENVVIKPLFKNLDIPYDSFSLSVKSDYMPLLHSMLDGYELLSNDYARQIVNRMFLYIDDPSTICNLMLYYLDNSREGMHRFMNLWLKTVAEELNALDCDSQNNDSHDTSNNKSKDDLEPFLRKVQLADMLFSLEKTSKALQNYLQVTKTFSVEKSGYYPMPGLNKTISIPFKEFDGLLENLIPEHVYNLNHGAIPELSESTYRKYKQGTRKNAGAEITNGFTNYLSERYSEPFVRELIEGIMKLSENGDAAGLFLSLSYCRSNDKDKSKVGFFEDALRLVSIFQETLGEPELLIDNRILVFEQNLYELILKTIRYRGPFDAGGNDSLSFDIFRELSDFLTEYFTKPRILYAELATIGYDLTDILDKRLIGENKVVYKRYPNIVQLLAWNKYLRMCEHRSITMQDIREYNGLGYSLLFAGLDYINTGYRIISSARSLFEKQPAEDQESEDGQHTFALILSNLSTYFTNLGRTSKSSDMQQKSLELAVIYAEESLRIRNELKDGYRRFLAKSNVTLATAHYYLGNHFRDYSYQKEAETHYLESLKYNLNSFRICEELGLRSMFDTNQGDRTDFDHLLSSAEKAFGSARALIIINAEAKPERFIRYAKEMGYDNETLLHTLEECFAILKNNTDKESLKFYDLTLKQIGLALKKTIN